MVEERFLLSIGVWVGWEEVLITLILHDSFMLFNSISENENVGAFLIKCTIILVWWMLLLLLCTSSSSFFSFLGTYPMMPFDVNCSASTLWETLPTFITDKRFFTCIERCHQKWTNKTFRKQQRISQNYGEKKNNDLWQLLYIFKLCRNLKKIWCELTFQT